MTVALLANSRKIAPAGINGGGDAKTGKAWIEKPTAAATPVRHRPRRTRSRRPPGHPAPPAAAVTGQPATSVCVQRAVDDAMADARLIARGQ
jgi:hypothetical protein